MGRLNQALIRTEEEEFICVSCDEREFGTEEALLQHCRNARRHESEWCERCEWLFVSANARSQHVRDSNVHWLCSRCGFDEEEEGDLMTHLAIQHSFCYDCQSYCGDFLQHRDHRHHRCSTCHQEFECENELLMVRRPERVHDG